MNPVNFYNRFVEGIVIVILFILVIYGAVNIDEVAFKSDLKLENVGAALGALFIIVLLVERAVEIIVGIWIAPQAEQLKKAIELMTVEQKNSHTQDYLDAENELNRYKSQTKRFTLLISFTLSTIVCVAGVGLLSNVIEERAVRDSLMRGIDIVLTASLIAGGSDGFHQFVSALDTFFKETKKKLEQPNK